MDGGSKDNISEKTPKRSSINDLSDISEEDLKNLEDVNKTSNEYLFRKINNNARDRNYRDNKTTRAREREKDEENKRKRHNKRSEIQRYNVRKIIRDHREISVSRSRSRSRSSRSPANNYHKRRSPHSIRRRHSRSPQFHKRSNVGRTAKRSHHQQDMFRGMKHCFVRFQNIILFFISILDQTQDKRKDNKLEESKHKRSRRDSKSSDRIKPLKSGDKHKEKSKIGKKISPENIKIILQNEDSGNKRTKILKRDKKAKRQHRIAETQHSNFKASDKSTHADEISKEIIASGDNILISVSFTNKVAVKNTDNDKEKSVECITPDIGTKNSTPLTEAKGRSVSPQSKYENSKSRTKERKRKKEKKISKSRSNKNPDIYSRTEKIIKRNELKPIAFIDLDRSPGKEILSSPKEIIVLSDSEHEILRKNDTSKDKVEVEDTELDSDRPFVSLQSQPVLKFSINKKSNLLPINLLHDHDDDKNEEDENVILQSEQSERHLNDAYDPFNPTNSKSNSPTTNLQVLNDVSSSSDMIKNRKEKSPFAEKIFFEDNLISSTNSLRNDKKNSTSPLASNLTNLKANSFYENNFEFKSFKVPSPKNDKKIIMEDDATPYSPCSDGYQYDEAPPESPKEDEIINESRFNDDLKLKTPSKHLTHYKSLQETLQPYSRRSTGKNEQNLQKSPGIKKLSHTVRSKMKRYRNSLKEYDSLKSLNEKSGARGELSECFSIYINMSQLF